MSDETLAMTDAIALTVEPQRGGWSFVRQRFVGRKLLPKTTEVDSGALTEQDWIYELLDAKRRPLYRRRVNNPVERGGEVHVADGAARSLDDNLPQSQLLFYAPDIKGHRFLRLRDKDGVVAEIDLQRQRSRARSRDLPTGGEASQRGSVVGAHQIVNNGPPEEKYVIALLGEGFTIEEQHRFNSLCDRFLEYIQNQSWYADVGNALTLHRINVVSAESGAADPRHCGDGSTGTGTSPRTYFESSYCADRYKLNRLLMQGNNNLVTNVASSEVPGVDAVAVLVNSEQRGGSSDNYMVCWSALSEDWCDVLMHELGHLVFRLWDEYDYYSDPDSPEKDPPKYHEYRGPPIESRDCNVTTATSRDRIPWRHLIAAETGIPTALDPAGTHPVGLYHGAGRYHSGLYRPAYTCKMRKTNEPFCPVCEEIIKAKLKRYL